MPNIGAPELIIILVIALLILGPGKLPEVGASIGKSLREFRKASSDVQEATNIDLSTAPTPVPAPAAPTAPAVPDAAAIAAAQATLAAAGLAVTAAAPAATTPAVEPPLFPETTESAASSH